MTEQGNDREGRETWEDRENRTPRNGQERSQANRQAPGASRSPHRGRSAGGADDDDRAALDSLDARIRAARGPEAAGGGRSGRSGSDGRGAGMGLGMRIGVEMVVSVAVGCGIGYMLDVWLGTAPILMVVFLFLGAAAGVSTVYRVVQGLDEGVGLGRAVEARRRRDAAADKAGSAGADGSPDGRRGP